MNCDKCMHTTVCIYEAGAREFEKKMDEIKDKPAMISVNVSCEKFRFKFDPKKSKTDTKKIKPVTKKTETTKKADEQ